MGVFPADHLIVGHKNFEKSMDDAFFISEKERPSSYHWYQTYVS